MLEALGGGVLRDCLRLSSNRVRLAHPPGSLVKGLQVHIATCARPRRPDCIARGKHGTVEHPRLWFNQVEPPRLHNAINDVSDVTLPNGVPIPEMVSRSPSRSARGLVASEYHRSGLCTCAVRAHTRARASGVGGASKSVWNELLPGAGPRAAAVAGRGGAGGVQTGAHLKATRCERTGLQRAHARQA